MCVRLNESNWKQSAPSESDEKYIVLIFENGLAMKEQMILEDILGEIGRNNNLSNFPAKLPFEEANIRLVNYNKASKQKEDKVSLETHTMRSWTDDSINLKNIFQLMCLQMSRLVVSSLKLNNIQFLLN